MGQKDIAAKLNEFAALLEQDLPIPVIADRMGITKGYGYDLFNQIKARLGPQAR